MPTLLFYYPEKEKRWKLEVQGDRFTIGRSRDVEVCIPHTSVSKKHLIVERRGPRYFFRDLGSKNGIYHNDFRMSQGALTDGDELRVGSIRITFYRKSPPPPRAEQETAALPREDLAASIGPTDPEGGTSGQVMMDSTSTSSTGDRSVRARGDDLPAREAEREAGGLPPSEDDLDRELDGDLDELELVPTPGEVDALDEIEPLRAAAPARARKPRAPPEGGPAEVKTEPRRISPKVLVISSVACVGLGFLLGYLGGRLDRDSGDPRVETEDSPSAGGSSAVPEASSSGAGKQGLPDPLTTPADLEDPETRRRLMVRLHIDVAGRPPTQDEMKKLASLPHDRLWYEVVSRADRARVPRWKDVDAVFPRFFGRKAEPAEKAALLELARGDPDHFAFLAGTNRLYSSPGHRRKRTEVQLARSLFTDLVGSAPGLAEEKTVLEAIRGSKGGIPAVAQTLASSRNPAAGPRPDEPIDAWVENAYARLLLRLPAAEEREVSARMAAKGPDAWVSILAEMAGRDEYLSY